MSNPWQSIAKPNIDFNAKRVSESHPLSLFWGRDTQGRYLFIYDMEADYSPERKSLPKLAGISLGVARNGLRAKLVLVLNETSNWELFLSLCSDMIRATSTIDEPKSASSIFLRRLRRWQEFLKRKRPGILSPEAIKGLVGELLLLEERIAPAFQWDAAIASWKGPEGAPQDFAIHDTAIEVKCQSGGSKPSVRITSAEQLMPQLPDCYLVVYTISTAEETEPDSFTLNELTARIQQKLEPFSETMRDRFEELLFLAGYSYREEYDEPKFKRIAVKCYKICKGFPRITLSGIPAGIDHVSYSIQLEQCEPFQKAPCWWEERL